MQSLLNIKIFLVGILIFALGLASVNLAYYQTVNAQSAADAVCESVGGSTSGSGCSDDGGELGGSNIDKLLATALNILSFAAGVAAVIMIIIAGIKYITSNGDSGSVSSAKNTMIYAIIGIVIVALSQVIVRFVLTQTN